MISIDNVERCYLDMYDIIAYCSKKYQDVLLRFLPSWLDTNVFKVHIYCDHGHSLPIPLSVSGRVEIYEVFGPCPDTGTGCARKTEAVHLHMGQIARPTILLDVDCCVTQDLGHVFDGTFDIGVAINPRSKPKARLNNCSGGFLLINNTQQAKQFIQQWVEKQRLEEGPSRDQACLAKTVATTKCKIKEFSEDIYNCHPYTNTVHHLAHWIRRVQKPLDLDETKQTPNHVIHFAHKTWKKFSPEQVLGMKQGGE